MKTNRRKRDTYDNVVSTPERIFQDEIHTAATLGTATDFGNLSTVPWSVKAALQEPIGLASRDEGDDTFDSLVNRPVLEEHPALRTQTSQCAFQHSRRIQCAINF